MKPILIFYCCITIIFSFIPGFAANPGDREISRIYGEIAGKYPVKIKETRASFNDGKNEWTIFGAVQRNSEPYVSPPVWSVAKNNYDLLVVKEPISDIPILPNSEPVPNTTNNPNISLKAYRDTREPLSFVIRSGPKKLEHVMIKANSLKSPEGHVISARNMDVRGVKCWYQAGLDVSRQKSDKKRLTPELLLHDLDLVRVDHKHQVNLVRDISRLVDAPSLLPFNIPPQTNQQIWVSTYIPANTRPGTYRGKIKIIMTVAGRQYKEILNLSIEVAALELKAIPVEHALFYLAWYNPNQTGLGARSKNARQMLAEFKDMREHGLTNVAIDHECKIDKNGDADFSNLEPVIKLFRDAGFKTKRFLYVDWRITGWDNPGFYRKKIKKLKDLVTRYGFTELYVYNKDEQEIDSLKKIKNTFEIVHQLGAKNFVACERYTATLMRGLLDQAILPRDTNLRGFNSPEINLCVNGDMSIELGKPGAAWRSTNKALMYIQNGRVHKKPGDYIYFAQILPLEIGKQYRLEYDVVSVRTGGLTLAAGGGSAVDRDIELPLSPGKKSVIFTSNKNNSLRLAAARLAEFEITNIAVTGIERSPAGTIGAWAYSGPQAGQETPQTYRERYGTSLLSNGFDGVCNYAYQSGDCWDDWAETHWRPHNMSYPTMGDPIPTIQWEGWRKAVDDIRINISRR